MRYYYLDDSGQWKRLSFLSHDPVDAALQQIRWFAHPQHGRGWAVIREDGVVIAQSKDADINALKLSIAVEAVGEMLGKIAAKMQASAAAFSSTAATAAALSAALAAQFERSEA